jgi:hypothetical protein
LHFSAFPVALSTLPVEINQCDSSFIDAFACKIPLPYVVFVLIDARNRFRACIRSQRGGLKKANLARANLTKVKDAKLPGYMTKVIC